jgi:aspartyl-tRNA synthetase
MKRTLISETLNSVGDEIKVSGWVRKRRDHGKIVFLDIRDMSGLLQVVVLPGSNAYEKVEPLRPEWVVSITGKINKRPDTMINPELATGTLEMEAKEIEILNEAKTPPFEIDKDTKGIDEELRLKYRYLDLRSDRMNRNITLRHEIVKFIREYLWDKNFREIETPYLTKSTPEGAREFVVPSRLYPGEFYVLPQSPQQFKQMLMIAGIERYFQIARCFRDEDQRGDRQPEFTQLDIEMSFVDQNDIMDLVENMMIKLIAKLFPKKKIKEAPFDRITYNDSIDKYNSDKPDLRADKNDKDEMAFCWIIDKPVFVRSKSEGKLVSDHHPFTMPNAEDIDRLDSEPEKVRAYSYDLVLNGLEIAGGSIRIHKREIQDKIFNLLGVDEYERNRRFGHMLEAFEYGAPPHGGIASGLDRVASILCDEDVIREAMAFPKTGDARDPLMGAPSPVSKKQLDDVHISIKGDAKSKAIERADTETNE